MLSVEAQWRDPHYAARNLRTTVEHNEFVFGELLGLSAREIAALEAAAVIA